MLCWSFPKISDLYKSNPILRSPDSAKVRQKTPSEAQPSSQKLILGFAPRTPNFFPSIIS